jgi:negative regulator of flagellin synthesis FlgM
MNNPINPINRSSTNHISNGTGRAPANTSPESSTSSNTDSKETVNLSSVQELQKHLSNIPEVDSAKVELLKQEIARGNYPLDPAKIAANLISLEQSLLE